MARPEPVAPPPEAPPPAPGGPGRSRGLPGGRRGLAVAGAAAVLLLVAAVVAVVVAGDDEGGGAGERGGPGRGGRGSAPAAIAGRDVPLLDGRVVFVAPAGWEVLSSHPDTASVQAQLRNAAGRELLGTVVVTFLPGEGSFESALAQDGATPFSARSTSGDFEAVVVAKGGQVLAGAARPSGRYLVSLSVYAMDGQGTDAALLQELFTEQVAPQLRFP